MRISVLQENLSKGLSMVSRAVSPRSTLPVLANILVATDEGRLRLSATNFEMGITCWIGAKIEEEGSTTVPARAFTDLVSTLTDKQVDMNLNVRTQTLNIRSGASNTDLKCIDSQEFPVMHAADPSNGIQINLSDFKEMVQQVVFAASDDQARPVLTGVLIQIENNRITMAAADGFRLSVRKAELASTSERKINIIIPARAMSELVRIVSDGDKLITMIVAEARKQVVFRLGDIELISQLIEGNFPDYTSIIPSGCETRAVLSTTSFLKAVKQAEIFAREGSYTARINIIPGGDLTPGTVEISGQSDETGSNQNKVDATIEGNPLLIAFNVRYLREVLDVIKTQNVALETTKDTRPGVVRPVGGEQADGNFIHVIMPMHLGS